jgi:hypothetical protein
MKGLSITAIGLRPLPDCLDIFEQLHQPLQLDFLELAIGSTCTTDAIYPQVPLILHDSCLYHQGIRQRLSLNHPHSWTIYAEFAATHPVAALSLHAPLKRDRTLKELEAALKALEKTVQVPVFIEVMPSPEYWCSSIDSLVDHPLLLDVSHVLIWHQGRAAQTQETSLTLLNDNRVGAIHISHNNGAADAHDLIPIDIWFNPYLADWTEKYFVTYESLPEAQAIYERRDKRQKRSPMHRRN